MKIIIDTEKKSVEVPNDFKKAYDSQVKVAKMLGKESDSILSMLDIKDYKVVSKQVRKVLDNTNAKTIEDFMKKVKESNKDKYEEYKELKEKVVKVSPKGKQIKTNFLTIKKWFYTNFPEQNPYKK